MALTEREFSGLEVDQSRRPLWSIIIGKAPGGDGSRPFYVHVGGPDEAIDIIQSDPSYQDTTGPWTWVHDLSKNDCEILTSRFGTDRQAVWFMRTGSLEYPEFISPPIVKASGKQSEQ